MRRRGGRTVLALRGRTEGGYERGGGGGEGYNEEWGCEMHRGEARYRVSVLQTQHVHVEYGSERVNEVWQLVGEGRKKEEEVCRD